MSKLFGVFFLNVAMLLGVVAGDESEAQKPKKGILREGGQENRGKKRRVNINLDQNQQYDVPLPLRRTSPGKLDLSEWMNPGQHNQKQQDQGRPAKRQNTGQPPTANLLSQPHFKNPNWVAPQVTPEQTGYPGQFLQQQYFNNPNWKPHPSSSFVNNSLPQQTQSNHQGKQPNLLNANGPMLSFLLNQNGGNDQENPLIKVVDPNAPKGNVPQLNVFVPSPNPHRDNLESSAIEEDMGSSEDGSVDQKKGGLERIKVLTDIQTYISELIKEEVEVQGQKKSSPSEKSMCKDCGIDHNENDSLTKLHGYVFNILFGFDSQDLSNSDDNDANQDSVDMDGSDDENSVPVAQSIATYPIYSDPRVLQCIKSLGVFWGNFMANQSSRIIKLREDKNFCKGFQFMVFAKMMESKGFNLEQTINFSYPQGCVIGNYLQTLRQEHPHVGKTFQDILSNRLKRRYKTLGSNIQGNAAVKTLFESVPDVKMAFFGNKQ